MPGQPGRKSIAGRELPIGRGTPALEAGSDAPAATRVPEPPRALRNPSASSCA
jgi:hypothetical protein